MRELITALIEALTTITATQRQHIAALAMQNKDLYTRFNALQDKVDKLASATGVVLLDNDIRKLLDGLKNSATALPTDAAPVVADIATPAPVADNSTGFDSIPEVKQ